MKPSLLLLALVALSVSASAAPWVSRHGMTASDYQTEFNKWTAAPYNYRLVSVCGYEKSNQARYAAIWEQRPGPGWITHPGVTSVQFNSLSATYADQGFVPVVVNGFAVGSGGYHNAIWEHQPTVVADAAVALTHPDYLKLNATRLKQGYELVYVSTYNVGSVEYFDVIWRKNDPATYHVQIRRSGSEYQSDFNGLSAQGYQLVTVSTAVVQGQKLYTSVWKLPGDGSSWYSIHNLSEVNYQGQTSNWYYQGYRPVFASAFVDGNATRFNAIWYRNGGLSPVNLATINAAINNYMATGGTPGLSLAVSRNGRLVYAKGFGQADQAANEWVHPNHRFRIASVSKAITGAAVLKLNAHCGLDLDDTVFGANGLLGNRFGTAPYSAREQAITVRQLLYHTSGWTTDGIWKVNSSNPGDAINWQLDNADGEPGIPGMSYCYMNVGYATLGRIIEQRSGKSYEQFVKDELLTPSGITGMEIGAKSAADRKPGEVVYYDSGGDPYGLDPRRMDAHGGWISTAKDLLLLSRRMDGFTTQADLLPASTLTEMRTPSGAPDGCGNGNGNGYGLGVFSANWSGVMGWGHNGGMSGTAGFLISRNDGLAFAFLCNSLTPGDGPSFSLAGIIDNFVTNIENAGAWPTYDLFPGTIPSGPAPTVLEVPRTFYVDHLSNCLWSTGSQNCGLGNGPFKAVNQAVAQACGGDDLFIRAGSYNERVVFNRPVLVRSYDGTAVIGQ